MRWCWLIVGISGCGRVNTAASGRTVARSAPWGDTDMIVEWLEILAGVLGAIGVIAAFVLGYRAPRATESEFKIRIQPRPVAPETYSASLIATHPADQPIVLRARAVRNPARGS